ncbi:MAG: GNAT family N-acetyltransferase [Parvularculaceae bacterium]
MTADFATIRLETDRLVLRPMLPEDLEPHCAMMADPRVARFLSLDQKPQPKPMAWRQLASYLGHWQIRGFGFFSVLEKSSGRWVGRVGPWMPEGWPALEAGWGIAPEHWGKGYAPEAAIAAIQWVFETRPALPRIISLIDPTNANSQSVARKVGEAKTGETFKVESFTLDVWAAERNDWLRRFGR